MTRIGKIKAIGFLYRPIKVAEAFTPLIQHTCMHKHP